MPIKPTEKLAWVEAEIEKLFPAYECQSCIFDHPEDGGTHVDHFFHWVKGLRDSRR